jgi:hypothetical protein
VREIKDKNTLTATSQTQIAEKLNEVQNKSSD